MSKDFKLKVGDIIQLKKANNSNPFKAKSTKLYKIVDITGDSVKLKWRVESIPLDAIEPVPLDSLEMGQIHLHHKGERYPFVVAGMDNKCLAQEYYIESIKKLGWNELVEKIENKEFLLLNEVQSYIKEKYSDYYLEINS